MYLLVHWLQESLISMLDPVAAPKSVPPVAAAVSATDLLVDVFGDLPPLQLNLPPSADTFGAPSELTPGAEEGYER